MRIAFALLALSYTGISLQAETLSAGEGSEYQDVCSAIADAVEGDTIEVSGQAATSHCAWTTPKLTIKGVGARPVIKAGTGVSIWSIAADDTVIENLWFEGSRCATGACVVIEMHSGSLTLRSVSISGSDIGVRASNSEGGALTIERSEIAANASNVEVGRIARFTLLSSYVHEAKGGGLVTTAAVENIIHNNRLASGSDESASGELVISDSSRTDVSGNVLVRVNANSTAGLIQYLNTDGQPGEIVAQRNTFVNAATSGIDFIESVGDQPPTVRAERNVFWGDNPAGAISNGNAAWTNYFGIEEVFGAEGDFRLNGNVVSADWGAFSADNSSFPMNVGSSVASTVETPEPSGKGRTKDALSASAPRSVALTSTTVGGASYIFNNKVYLNGPAPSGGATVTLRSSNAAVVTMLNPSILIRAGATSGVFGFKTSLPSATTTVSITATAGGGAAAASVQVGPASVSKITMGATEIGTNGSVATNRVQLTGPAPAGGMVVSLTSSSPYVKVPATVTIPAGITSNAFTIKGGTIPSPATVTITATKNGISKSATIRAVPASVSSMLVTPSFTSGGQTILVKAYLNGPAPSGGMSVAIRSSNPTVLPLPSTILIPAGATEHAVLTRLGWVSANTSITVTANTSHGSETRTITAIPTQMAGVLASDTSIRSYGSVSLSLRLSGPAPSGGLTVALSSSSGALSVPSSVRVPAGARSFSVTAKAGRVSSTTSASVRASAGGVTKSSVISVAP